MAYLEFQNISKTFPGVRALGDVSFGVREGTVHALMGENGAGKSTLLKILSGAYQPDEGRLQIGPASHRFTTTADAIAAGVAVIYQELFLIPEMTVAENLFLGHLPNRGGWLRRQTLVERARALLDELGEPIDPNAKLGSLPIGQRQMVEIAKALSRDAKVIAFDEPTSSLSARETDRLFAVIRRLRGQGKAILYVSHRMDEIYAISDAATVLRDGRHVETFEKLEGVTRDTLVRRMVGRPIEDVFKHTPRTPGEVRLRVHDVNGIGLRQGASFLARRGEIVGFFGLVGAGRTELMRLVYGAAPRTSGSVSVDNIEVHSGSPSDSIRRGLVLLPEDRKKEGIIPLESVAENINLSVRRSFAWKRLVINRQRERDNAAEYVRKLSVKTPSLAQAIRNLSGGNQQKVLLARWLSEGALKVVLLDEPTRGIDVGAKSEIYSIIYALAAEGCAVVVVSSELPEVLGLCDRIIVMREGELVGSLNRDEATQERVLELALPVTSAVATK